MGPRGGESRPGGRNPQQSVHMICRARGKATRRRPHLLIVALALYVGAGIVGRCVGQHTPRLFRTRLTLLPRLTAAPACGAKTSAGCGQQPRRVRMDGHIAATGTVLGASGKRCSRSTAIFVTFFCFSIWICNDTILHSLIYRTKFRGTVRRKFHSSTKYLGRWGKKRKRKLRQQTQWFKAN